MSQINKRAVTDEDLSEAIEHGAWETAAKEGVDISEISPSDIPEIVFVSQEVLTANVLLAPTNRIRKLCARRS